MNLSMAKDVGQEFGRASFLQVRLLTIEDSLNAWLRRRGFFLLGLGVSETAHSKAPARIDPMVELDMALTSIPRFKVVAFCSFDMDRAICPATFLAMASS